MTGIKPLVGGALCRRCDPAQFDFESTADLEDLGQVVGQARAVDSLQFAVGMQAEGYNPYVLGSAGLGRHTIVERLLRETAATRGMASDWCYVNNFADPQKPKALRLPPRQGAKLRNDIAQMVEELGTAIPAAFESDEYRSRLQEIQDELSGRQEAAFDALQKEAEAEQISLLRTPGGFAFAPMRDGEALSPDKFQKLDKEEQQHIESVVGSLQERLQNLLRQIPQWRKETKDKIRELNREITLFAVGHRMAELRGAYTDQPDVLAYLDAFEHDVIDHMEDFRRGEEGGGGESGPLGSQRPSLRRYQINVLVDHSEADGAPVVYEDNPSYQNLVGRVEHLSQLGALITDFTLIKPGALHRANGGYLLLDAHKVLLQPYAWEGLKRALFSRQIRIESLAQIFSLVSTVSLEPDPIPLQLKVVLVGERLLYYLLCHYDPDFPKLFKVAADFNERIERNDESNQIYARLLGTLAREHKIKPMDRTAVARVIDHSARLAGDAERLSVHIGGIADLLQEADYWAGQAQRELISAADVQHAIDAQIRRADRMRERLYEEIQRGTILVDTDGERVGQVNALSVIDLGNFAFGQPSRVTATARLGEGELVDIEREVELGGAIHSKGVLILSNFLAARYARNRPLSLAASLVFEQSYGMVEGDSASLAELCALLSALAQLPIRQSLALTGSVNQLGQVQPIGGVNEKVEGFFDVCSARGLTGQQGVLIPATNVKHLMLRDDVVEAANSGRFHIYPVATVDEALELLTGVPAGSPDERGGYPEDSANQRVDARLEELLQLRLAYAERARETAASAKGDPETSTDGGDDNDGDA